MGTTDSTLKKEHSSEHHFSTGHLLVNLKGRTISSGFVTAVAQGIQFILTLASTMVLARLLTPQDFGLLAMVATIMGFLRIFSDAGLSTATVQREGITHHQVSNLFWINVAVSGTMSLIVAGCAPLIAWFYREPQLVGITLVLSASFLLGGLTVQHRALLNRQMRFKAIAIIQIVALVLGALVGIIMAWLKCGYWSLVGFQMSTLVVTLLMTWSASRWRPHWPKRHSGTRSLLNFGVNLSASNFILSVSRGMDGLLVGRVYGADAVGLYSRAAALLLRPLETFTVPINAVFVPTLSRLQDQPERYRRTFLKAYEAIALIGFLFTGLFFALARPLTLVVLGPKWESAAAIFAGFTIAALFYPLSSTSTWLFTSQGRGRDFLLTSLICSGVMVGSFFVGLPYGPVGVALAFSVCGLLIQLPILYHIAGRSGPVGAADLWRGFFRHLPVWVVVCGATYLTRSFVESHLPLAQLFISAPVGLLAGIAFIYMYNPSRRVAAGLFDVLHEFRRARKTSTEPHGA